MVDDIEAEIAALKALGVIFEGYDTPLLKTFNSIAETDPSVNPLTGRSEPYPKTVRSSALSGPIKLAWFKDSEGNLLGLVQFV